MKKIEATVTELLRQAVAHMGCEWVGCEYVAQGKHSLLRIYIDKPDGITLEDCQRVTEGVNPLLDVENVLAGPYTLEVSSPGLDRPLFSKEDYQRFVGETAEIKLRIAQEGRRGFKGQLMAVLEHHLNILVEGQIVSLLLENILKANLVAKVEKRS